MMKSVARAISLLNTRVSWSSVQSVRYYPRWTHRTPGRVFYESSTRGPKASVKLNAEKEIVRSSGFPDSSPLRGIGVISDSVEEKLVVENHTKDTNKRNDYLGDIKVKDANDKVEKVQRFREERRETTANVWETRSTQNAYQQKERPKANRIQEKFPRSEKKTSISGKELKRRESAAKLGVPLFEKVGTDDSKLSSYVLKVKAEKIRKKTGMFLLEGKRLIKDAVEAGVVIEALFFTRVEDIQDLGLPQTGIKLIKMTYKEMDLWTDVSTHPGLMGFAKIPDVGKERPFFMPLTIICDNIRDPGNLGAILRTSAAVGCAQVILTKGCVDLWNPKVVRAGAGSHFKLRIKVDADWSDLLEEADEDAAVFVADNDSYDISVRDDESDGEAAVGNEDNVQMMDTVSRSAPDYNMPLIPYFSCNFNKNESLILIIGGETKGVSVDAYDFVYKMGGIRLNIPLSNEVESLNTGTALGIISFEMKKQFLQKKHFEEHAKTRSNVSTV